MIDYSNSRRYARKRFFSSVVHTFWSAICLIGALVLIYFIVQWATPWFETMNDTVMK